MRREYVDTYRNLDNWRELDVVKISDIKKNIAPIIQPSDKDELARRFDYVMYSIMLGTLNKTSIAKPANIVVASCQQLTTTDLEMLEKILWEELGSKDDYAKDYGEKPVGMLVREIVGMEQSAVNEAFSEFISAGNLNSKQIDFVNMIINYIVKNGNIVDVKTTFSQQPFKGFGGGVGVLFKDKMPIVKNIMDRVAQIKKNAEEIAQAL